ncbi:MAG TPA: tetratricopeptide repeat protein [Xanthobacteraceae bacterium]|nr:tetratricopeptide repeat protein [Xanthobacteraceae bacterium]
MTGKPIYSVMLSSTYMELTEHRRAVADAMIGQGMLPLAMEFDAALPDQDLIDASLAKVDAADAYVGLISFRYGQTPKCATRNPRKWSLTEIEFRRAVDRGIPICMFITDPKHTFAIEDMSREHGSKRKLAAFVKRAKADRIYAEFQSVADLKAKAIQSLVRLREVLDRRAAKRVGDPPRADIPAAGAPLPESLVVRPTRCIGRDDDTKALVEMLTQDGDAVAVLVLGGPGMGKTTLTREAASRPDTIKKFGQRRWFIELETATNAEAMEQAIVVALGLDPASARLDAALARLGQAPGLLVLDNLETPWDGERGEREKVEALLTKLHRVSGLALLASIRGNEPPAGVRWSRQRTMHPLEPPHDLAMFLDIAKDINPDDPALAPLLTALGGVPIAIELMAQLAAAHDSLSAIHAEWQRVGSAIAKRRGVEPSRLSSLEVSLELSFQSARLGDQGRRLFSILGQLPAGIAPDDLSTLLGDAAFEARQGLLSTALGTERADRLDLLPPVRDHARRQHAPSDDDADRWRKHYLGLARDIGGRIGGPEGGAAVRRLSPELPNLDAAQSAALTARQLPQAIEASAGITVLLRFTGLGTSATIRKLATAAHEAGDTRGEANCIRDLGDIARDRSDHEAARKAYEQALPLYRQLGQVRGEAECISGLGDIALARSDHEPARKAYEQALPLYRRAVNIRGEANCIQSLGEIALRRSDHDVARTAFEQALPLYRQIGDIVGEANCIHRLGLIAREGSDQEAARNAYEQALALHRQVGDLLGEANCIHSLGAIAFDRSDHEAARKAFEQALPLYRQIGDILGEANCIEGLGDIALAGSDREAARKAYQRALGLFEKIPEPYSIGFTHRALALVTQNEERANHRAAAHQAWLSIGRQDLVEKYLSDPDES